MTACSSPCHETLWKSKSCDHLANGPRPLELVEALIGALARREHEPTREQARERLAGLAGVLLE
jgi:hypothetical protein